VCCRERARLTADGGLCWGRQGAAKVARLNAELAALSATPAGSDQAIAQLRTALAEASERASKARVRTVSRLSRREVLVLLASGKADCF